MSKEPPFRKLLDALLDADTPLPPRYLYRLSDLEGADLQALVEIWPRVAVWRRRAILQDMDTLSESDTLISFVSVAKFALQDEDAPVRLLAVRSLWEYEEPEVIPDLLCLLQTDSDIEVRAAAAGALGPYIYLGELERIGPHKLRQIEDALLQVVSGSDPAIVQRSALEALGYSSREEVPPLLQDAYASGSWEWIASALFAMGSSADERWNAQVLEMLNSDFPAVRSEAVRSAGKLAIADAVPLLMEMVDDPDDETHLASIWSLSQIGGEGVRDLLERLYDESEDEADLDMLEEAIENLSLTEGEIVTSIFDIAEDEFDEDFEPLSNGEDLDD